MALKVSKVSNQSIRLILEYTLRVVTGFFPQHDGFQCAEVPPVTTVLNSPTKSVRPCTPNP